MAKSSTFTLLTVEGHFKMVLDNMNVLIIPISVKFFIILKIIKHVLDYLYFLPPGCPAFGHFTAH